MSARRPPRRRSARPGRSTTASVAGGRGRALLLRSAGLTRLPASLGRLAALEEVDLAGNRVSAFPEVLLRLRRLRWLSLGDNKLQFVPDDIGGLSGLTHLYLYGN